MDPWRCQVPTWPGGRLYIPMCKKWCDHWLVAKLHSRFKTELYMFDQFWYTTITMFDASCFIFWSFFMFHFLVWQLQQTRIYVYMIYTCTDIYSICIHGWHLPMHIHASDALQPHWHVHSHMSVCTYLTKLTQTSMHLELWWVQWSMHRMHLGSCSTSGA